MARCLLVALIVLVPVQLVPAQDVAPLVAPVSVVTVKTSTIAAYKGGAEARVRGFLYRYISKGPEPKLGTAHPRFVHAVAITNVEPVACETQFFHWDDEKAVVLDLPVADPQFLVVFSRVCSEEIEYARLNEDFFTMDGEGFVRRAHEVTISEGSKLAQEALRFSRLDRKEQFAELSTLLAPIWPFRPGGAYVHLRTAGSVKDGFTTIAVRPPNFVTLEGRAAYFEMTGEVAVVTCK